LKYARWLLAITAACLPLYTVRWDYGRLPTTLLENLVVATVVLYLVALWRERQLGRLLSLRTAYDIPILLLLVAGVVSLLVAKDHRAALGLYKAYFIEPVVLFYVASDLLRQRDDFRTVLLGLGIGTSLFALLNVGYFAAAFLSNTVQYGAPPSAIYTSSNEVALFLEPPAAFATAFFLFSDLRRDRRLALAWAICLGVALLLTFSRGAYLALAVFAIVTLITVRPGLRRPLLAIAVVAAALVVVTIVVASNTPLMESRFSYVALNYTLQTRSIIYVATWQMLTAHPILGLGLGGYLYVLHGFPEIYPHDVYLAFWAELGLLGLVAFLIILAGLIWRGWRALPLAAGFERALLWGALGSFVLWGVHGIFDTPYWKNDMSVEFWLVAAIQVAVIRRLVSNPGPKQPEPRS
jgi:O-antigen ligase